VRGPPPPRLSTLGPISLVLREEATPRDALDTLCRYLRLVNPSMTIRVEDTDSLVVIREDLLPSPGVPMRQSVELAVGVLFRMLRDLTGPHWRPLEVCFTHRPPMDVQPHRAFFGRRVKFNQEFNGLVCLAVDLSKPREPGDPVAAGFARKHLDLALRDRSESVQEACRQLILALLPGGACTAQEVARHMRVDRRTLHRRLDTEGLTFSGLLDQVRANLIESHLRESDLPLREVAELLGFSRQSSFSHWFRRRFGCSPTQWSRRVATAAASGERGESALR
jgi:AraC-like DNA-binding protein